MNFEIRSLIDVHAEEASGVVRESFLALAAADWRPEAGKSFLEDTAPSPLRTKLSTMAFVAGAFCENQIAGVILMPSPALVGLLFVRPRWLRLGIGRALWESARAHIETAFPEVHTVELNATPYAVRFYKSVGFVPISTEFEREGRRAIRMACWLPGRVLGAAVE